MRWCSLALEMIILWWCFFSSFIVASGNALLARWAQRDDEDDVGKLEGFFTTVVSSEENNISIHFFKRSHFGRENSNIVDYLFSARTLIKYCSQRRTLIRNWEWISKWDILNYFQTAWIFGVPKTIFFSIRGSTILTSSLSEKRRKVVILSIDFRASNFPSCEKCQEEK